MIDTQLMTQVDVLKAIQEEKMVAILRGEYRAIWTDVAQALYDGGFRVMEVTFGCPEAVAGIAAITRHMGGKMLVGVGTVMTPIQVDEAVGAGARFIVAPNTDPAVVARALYHDALAVPGAFTATEIVAAYKLGAMLIKVFPSAPVGPSYIRNLRGPLPDIPFMCTGGITAENGAEFLKAGADAVGFTASLMTGDEAKPGGIERLRERARQTIQKIRS